MSTKLSSSLQHADRLVAVPLLHCLRVGVPDRGPDLLPRGIEQIAGAQDENDAAMCSRKRQAVATVGGAVEEAAAGASTVDAEVAQEVAGAVQGMADAVQEVAEAGRQAVARSATVGIAVQSGARGLVREQVEALVVDADARVRVQAGDSLWRISQRCQVMGE
ncbi:unnamed protein product [Closterium sp. NIES-65]|nr:unnamed protein product [Closterium sp. NIES-65]